MVPDMEVRMEERCVTEILHEEKLLPLTFINLLNIDGDQREDANTVKWQVLCFSSCNSHTVDGHTDFYKLALDHHWWKYIANGSDYAEKKSVLQLRTCSISVIGLFVSVVLAMLINRMCYFWSNLQTSVQNSTQPAFWYS